ncbi:hypothetical protein GOBAR_AA10723 [Gossypium barbadense]|uniref:NAC domain-containing protein n=1 Tax=Gossypium barbadense TaxID=3634 RepID=A0A2P5Y2U0_GOSBA|nr:hypothetical protein GOBAR_AA10723 [Gossypium barbadense]
MGVPETDPLAQLSLPPGFRFYPTDEELLVQYLCRKVAGHHFSLQIIAEIDLYKFDPWVLPSKAIFGEKEWYFFSPRDRKYPNGSRPNRVAGSGYWKATGTDKVITTDGRKVGIKKALVFYVGKAPKGTKTNWIMHEYRLLETSRKNGSSKSFPELHDRYYALPRMNSLKTLQNDDKTGFHNLGSGNLDWASLAGLNSVPESVPSGQTQTQGIQSYVNNDLYVPTMPPTLTQMDMSMSKVGNSVEEEVQSGLRTQRVNNSGFFQQNSSGLMTQNFSNLIDPYGFRYPTQPGGFVFKQ